MESLLIALIALLAGVLLCIGGVFAFFLVRSVIRLDKTVSVFNETMKAMVENSELPKAAKSLSALVNLVPDLTVGLKSASDTISVFTKAVFRPEVVGKTGAVPESPEGESGFYTYSEEEMAIREQAEELKKHGIVLDRPASEDPKPEQMKGAEV